MIEMDSGFNSNFWLKIDSGRILSIITNDYKAIKTSKVNPSTPQHKCSGLLKVDLEQWSSRRRVSLSKNLFNGYDSPIS